jgi:hypothetical protein
MSSSKSMLGLEQITKDLPRPIPSMPIPLKSRKEEDKNVARPTDDEVIVLLREIATKINQPPVARWQESLKLAITIILCVVTLAGAFAVVVGSNSKLELKMENQIQENLRLWQEVRTLNLQVEDINKRDAVRKALEDNAKRR